MPRPQKCRRVCALPGSGEFGPAVRGCREIPVVMMRVDEYEVIRLIDLEGLTQEQCAVRMEVARTTVTGIYESARRKLADVIVNGKRLVISGGSYRLCDEPGNHCSGRGCRRCQIGKLNSKKNKEETHMKIAVTYENGQVYQHFGHTEQFKVYTVDGEKIVSAEVVGTNGTGHGALAMLLRDMDVDTLICGGIGGGARTALAEAGVTLYGGVSGTADAAFRRCWRVS